MSEQRDELALELFIADNFKQPREQSIKDWEWYKTAGTYQGRVEGYKGMADGMISAGYRKPRTDGEREWGIAWSAQEENGTTACDNKGAAYRLRDKMRKVGWVAEVVSRPAFPWETEPEPNP